MTEQGHADAHRAAVERRALLDAAAVSSVVPTCSEGHPATPVGQMGWQCLHPSHRVLFWYRDEYDGPC